MKTCSKCGISKPIDCFSSTRPDCRLCISTRGKAYRESLGTTEMTGRKHGITSDLYNAVLDVQGGMCAICGRPPQSRALSIDHDHQSGKLRGLLCARCNGGLGMFQDSPELLFKAAQYLSFWAQGWAVWNDVVR